MGGVQVDGFGARDFFKKEKYMGEQICPRCKKRAPFYLEKGKMKVTLLWIPTVTVRERYVVMCEKCEVGTWIEDEVAYKILNGDNYMLAEDARVVEVNKTAPTPQIAAPQAPGPQTAPPQAAAPQAPRPQTAPPQAAVPQAPRPQTAPPQAAVPQAPRPQTAPPQIAAPQAPRPQTVPPQAAPQVPRPQTAPPQAAPQAPRPQTAPPQAAPQAPRPQTAPPQAAPQAPRPQTAPPQAAPQAPRPQTVPPQAAPQVPRPQTAPQAPRPQTAPPQAAAPQAPRPQTAPPQAAPAATTPICSKCGAELDGEFCGMCGTRVQRTETPVAVDPVPEKKRTCPNCGEEVKSAFCIKCGTKYTEPAEEELPVRICAQCGAVMEGIFCGECGAKYVSPKETTLGHSESYEPVTVVVDRPLVAPEDKLTEQVPIVEEEPPVRLCFNCGAELDGGFCGICGKKQPEGSFAPLSDMGPVADHVVAQSWECSLCGTHNPLNTTKCQLCGTDRT